MGVFIKATMAIPFDVGLALDQGVVAPEGADGDSYGRNRLRASPAKRGRCSEGGFEHQTLGESHSVRGASARAPHATPSYPPTRRTGTRKALVARNLAARARLELLTEAG